MAIAGFLFVFFPDDNPVVFKALILSTYLLILHTILSLKIREPTVPNKK